MQFRFPLILGLLAALAPLSDASTITELFKEREKTLVFIEYYTQREVDRMSGEGIGLVISEDGLVVCLSHVFADWVEPDRFRDIRIFPSGNPNNDGFEADYLGQDWVNGWHYLKIRDMEAAGEYLQPITDYEAGKPELGDMVWGVCMTPGTLDYVTYYREAKLSTIQPLPLDTAFATTEVAVPGGPVFLEDGRFAGWAGRSLPTERDMWIGQEYFRANVRNPDESLMFLLAEPFLEEVFARIPSDPLDHSRPWIGVSGTQPLEKETARFLGLTDQGVIIISEVLADTPAGESGLQDRDLLLKINGKKIPRLKPDSVLQVYFERELLLSTIGEPIQLTVLREDQEVDLEVIPALSPTMMKEAKRHYFEDIGLTIREFLVSDAISRREDHRQLKGVVASYIKPNSPAATGEIKPLDWIHEVDGKPVKTFQDAVEQIQLLENDENTEEIVLLVRRGTETTVLRIRKGNS
ncbi:MAG: PDZ domain-containing protein [Puniceicoccaceae bacterium]